MIAGLTNVQIRYFYDQLPAVRYYDNYQLAKFESTVLNIMGGKRKKKTDSSEPPLEDHELFTAEERLAYFAYIEGMETARLSKEAAKDLLDNLSKLPAWALAIAPVDEARALLK